MSVVQGPCPPANRWSCPAPGPASRRIEVALRINRQLGVCSTSYCGWVGPLRVLYERGVQWLGRISRNEGERWMLLRYTDSASARMHLRLCCAYNGCQLFPPNGHLSHMLLLLESQLSRPAHKESVCRVLQNRSWWTAGRGAASRDSLPCTRKANS